MLGIGYVGLKYHTSHGVTYKEENTLHASGMVLYMSALGIGALTRAIVCYVS